MKRTILLITFLFAVTFSNAQTIKGHFRNQGYDREYFIYIPDSLAAERPLVFMLHGHGGHADGYFPAFLQTARKYGFAVCYPQGLVEPAPKSKPAWNVGYPFQKGWKVDDCKFILALSKELQKKYNLDGRNVFFSGMSNGGEMCYLMAHRYPDEFAAIASLAGLNMEWIYREMTPGAVPFMEVHGTADMTSKWVGDPDNRDGWGEYISVPAAVGRMVSANCCTHEICDTLESYGKHPVIRHHYTGGTDGKDVFLYEVVGGKHARGEKDFALGEEMWAFFSRYLRK